RRGRRLIRRGVCGRWWSWGGLLGPVGRGGLRGRGGLADGAEDAAVGAAAADVTVQGGGGLLVARVGAGVEEGQGGHDHARGAVAALESLVVEERLLQGVEAAVLLQALDSEDVFAEGVAERGNAGAHGLVVKEDGARAALALGAAVLAAGQVQVLAQDDEEGHIAVSVAQANL